MPQEHFFELVHLSFSYFKQKLREFADDERYVRVVPGSRIGAGPNLIGAALVRDRHHLGSPTKILIFRFHSADQTICGLLETSEERNVVLEL